MCHLLYAGTYHSDCDMSCVVCWHVALNILSRTVACMDVTLRLYHVLMHTGIWHSGCAMCHVLCVVCRDVFMACRGTTCLFIMAVSHVPHGNQKLHKQTFGWTLMAQHSNEGTSSHTGMCISKYPLLPWLCQGSLFSGTGSTITVTHVTMHLLQQIPTYMNVPHYRQFQLPHHKLSFKSPLQAIITVFLYISVRIFLLPA